MQKRTAITLAGLYLFPWGIQCLVDNFLPVYVASLPFATEKTIGEILSIGAIVTMISQLIWTNFSARARNKCGVLALSLACMAIFALLFLLDVNKPLLILFTVLFYACYMTHQPLIDTIAAEKYAETRFSFGWFRSFASLGYAAFGLIYTFLPNNPPSLFFVYVSVLAGISLVLSMLIKAPNTAGAGEKSAKGGSYMNRQFIMFLCYSFILFMAIKMFSSFFSVYYSTDMGLGGSVEVFSLIISLATIGEWLIMLIFGSRIMKLGSRFIFIVVAVTGGLKSLVVFAVQNTYLMFIIIIFHSLFFAFLWASATPYIRRIVPENGLSQAQGVWTVATCGIAPFIGSYLSGVFAEAFGVRWLFMLIAALFMGLALLTPLFIKNIKMSE